MDRTDIIVGQTIDRAVTNTVHCGYWLRFATGDKTLDRDLKERWDEESVDPERMDADGELTFPDMEKLIDRQELVDGDIFPILVEDGLIELKESHRCKSPKKSETKGEALFRENEAVSGKRFPETFPNGSPQGLEP